MKSLKLKKIVAAAVAALTIASVTPVGASAAWKQDSNGWWNTEGSSYSTGWRSIDGAWYYFDETGYMRTGWVNDNGTWYYMQPSGAMQTGWVLDNGTWYYMQPSGEMKTGWVNDKGTWYYLQSSGAMKTGWINDNGTWYFAAASGAMQSGVVEVDGKVYYLAPSGAMQTGNVTIDGVTYTFAADGHAIGDKIPTATLKFTGNGAAVINKGTDDVIHVSDDSSSHHGGGGGSSSNNNPVTPQDPQKAAIETKYAAETKVNDVKIVDGGDNGKTSIITPVLPDTFKNELGKPAKTEVINGVTYSVKKDITVATTDGTDVGITQTALGEYRITKGTKVKITAVTSLLGSDGKLYYVSSESNEYTA